MADLSREFCTFAAKRAPQEELLADVHQKRRLKAALRGRVAGFARELQVHVENVVLGRGVDREPDLLDHAQVVGGQPDARR